MASPHRFAAPFFLLLCAACGGNADEARNERAGPAFDRPAEGQLAPPLDAPDIPPEAPTVLFLGDSIAAGLHLAEHQAFPAVLQRNLAADGRPFHLVNASESGRTTSGGLTALEWSLRSQPDLVVIALGGNDGLRGVDLETTEANLRALITRSRDAGARVLLLGVRLPVNYGDFADRFDALYPELAEELDVDFAPFYMEGVGAVPEMNLADGLHPTAEGHARLARNVEPAFSRALDELTAAPR